MKGLKWLGLLGVVVLIGVAVVTALDMGEKSPVFVSGTIQINDDLKADATGVETLFVIVYDEASAMPMPYGAMKEKMPADLSSPVPFLVTKESLRIMNPDAPAPKFLRLKVRIDRDGVAGPDQPGDLTGGAEHVPFGQRDIQVLVDKKAQ
ncbi:MAG: hypothetical protein H7249_15205 [Chitinophagaceae bacterium]|nr:hypothetical protein [Oligoflexus sp.]